MKWLSRIGVAVLVLALATVASALTLSLFPRSLLGFMLLFGVGIPAILLCEGSAALASDDSRPWYVQTAALFFALALIGLLWWTCNAHALFIHRHFFAGWATQANAYC